MNSQTAKTYNHEYHLKHRDEILRRHRERYAKNRDEERARQSKYRSEHRIEMIAASCKWGKKNRDKTRAASRKYYEANSAIVKARVTAFNRDHPEKANARNALRRSRKLNATPIWVDRAALLEIYTEATDRNLTVDHIVPLQHPLVCGLHVPWNLQLLTSSENSRKGNRFTI